MMKPLLAHLCPQFQFPFVLCLKKLESNSACSLKQILPLFTPNYIHMTCTLFLQNLFIEFKMVDFNSASESLSGKGTQVSPHFW